MTTEIGRFTGTHVLAEFDGIDAALLNDPPALETALHDSLVTAGATVCRVITESFQPHGVTVLALLAESHASIHTYPERGSAFADVFTCGERADSQLAVQLLADALEASEVHTSAIARGIDRPRAVSEQVGAGLRRTWQVDELRFAAETEFQQVLIGRTEQGVSLFCDDERQSTEATQLIYHEALMVPPLLLADRRERVLIVGSSEGVASQLAVAAGAQVVDHVDIDAEAVRACARHLPYGYTVDELDAAERGDGPIRMHYRDGWAFIADAAAGCYDVVVIDLPDETTDEQAQHNRLYGEEFLTGCARLLAPGGVIASQAGCPTVWRNDTLAIAWRRWSTLFPTVAYFGSDEHEWAFLAARTDPLPDPTTAMIERLDSLAFRPTSIDADTLRGSSVPPYSLRHPR